jgi:hypothetical protein
MNDYPSDRRDDCCNRHNLERPIADAHYIKAANVLLSSSSHESGNVIRTSEQMAVTIADIQMA